MMDREFFRAPPVLQKNLAPMENLGKLPTAAYYAAVATDNRETHRAAPA
jgi:hypothetical protein